MVMKKRSRKRYKKVRNILWVLGEQLLVEIKWHMLVDIIGAGIPLLGDFLRLMRSLGLSMQWPTN